MRTNFLLSFGIVVGVTIIAILSVNTLDARALKQIDKEMLSLMATLQSSERLHPAIGAIGPALDLPADGDHYFLVEYSNGVILDGNINSVEPGFAHSRPAQVSSFNIVDSDKTFEAHGFWLDVDGIARLFVGKPIPTKSLLDWGVFASAFTGLAAALLAIQYWSRISGKFYVRRLSTYLQDVENAIKGDALQIPSGKSVGDGNFSEIVSRVTKLTSQLKSNRQRDLELHRAMEHEVLRYIRSALDHLDHMSDCSGLVYLESKLERAEQNFLGLMELDAVGISLKSRFAPVDLEDCLKSILRSVESEALLQDIKVVLQIESADVPNAYGMEQHFGLLFSNLILNAIQYSPQGSQVDVQLGLSAAGGPSVNVRDSGPGLAGFHGSFDPDVGPKRIGLRGQSGAIRKGTGVGLMIVYAEVELLDATISMRDRTAGPTNPGLEVRVELLPVEAGSDDL